MRENRLNSLGMIWEEKIGSCKNGYGNWRSKRKSKINGWIWFKVILIWGMTPNSW